MAVTNTDTMPDCYGRSINRGEAVLLTAKHPHAGKRGTYKGLEQIAIGWGCLVALDEGGGCYVFKADQWRKAIE